MKERLDRRLLGIPVAVMHTLVSRVAEVDEFRGWWSGFQLPGTALLTGLESRSITASARAATWIQGTSVTTPESRLVWRGGAGGSEEGSGSPRATGYAEVLRHLFDNHHNIKLDDSLIRDFHLRLLRYAARDEKERGRYRSGSGRAPSGHERSSLEAVALRPSPPDRIPEEVAALIAWSRASLAARRFHPLFVIAGFVLEFLSIRPFAHGNGRLSRILTQLLLLQSGYDYVRYVSLDSVIADRWTEHYLALRRSQANRNRPEPDISAWVSEFVDTVHAQALELRQTVRRRPDERLLSRNHVAVLELLERRGEVTNRLVCRELAIPRETAKQALNRLVALGVLRRAGAGRAVRYQLLLSGE